MSSRFRAASVAAAVALLAVVLQACGGASGGSGASNSKGPITLGAIVDLSGSNSQVGQPEAALLKRYVARVNAAGGIDGRQLKLTVADGQSDQTVVVQAARRLAEQDGVTAVVGPTATDETLAVEDYLNTRKVPEISLGGGDRIVQPVRSWVFKAFASDALVAQAVLGYMRDHGIKRLGWLGLSDGYGPSGLAAFQAAAPAAGIKLAPVESFAGTDTDMTSQLTRIKAANPDAVMIYGAPPSSAIAQRNANALGIAVPIFHGLGSAAPGFVDQAGAAANGISLGTGKLLVADQIPASDPQHAALADFVELNGGPNTFAGAAYDAMTLLTKALAQGGTDRQKVRDALERTSGVAGVFNDSASDHNGLGKGSVVVVTLKDGHWKLAG
jgi:branched-chain amino acid transport system substrate-binding protein